MAPATAAAPTRLCLGSPPPPPPAPPEPPVPISSCIRSTFFSQSGTSTPSLVFSHPRFVCSAISFAPPKIVEAVFVTVSLVSLKSVIAKFPASEIHESAYSRSYGQRNGRRTGGLILYPSECTNSQTTEHSGYSEELDHDSGQDSHKGRIPGNDSIVEGAFSKPHASLGRSNRGICLQ